MIFDFTDRAGSNLRQYLMSTRTKNWLYSFTGLPVTLENAAARYSLSRVLGNRQQQQQQQQTFHDKGISPEMATAYARVLLRWRTMIKGLGTNGWKFVNKPKVANRSGPSLNNFLLATNCCPAAVFTDPDGARCCRQYRICPWCWVRQYTVSLFNRLEHIYFGGTYRHGYRKLLRSLVVRQRTYNYLVPGGIPEIPDLFEFIRQDRFTTCIKQLRKTEGSSYAWHFRPLLTQPMWVASLRVVTLHQLENVAYAVPAEMAEGAYCYSRVNVIKKRSDIVPIAGRFGLYPRILMYAPLALTAALLNYQHESVTTCLSGHTGLFRMAGGYQSHSIERNHGIN